MQYANSFAIFLMQFNFLCNYLNFVPTASFLNSEHSMFVFSLYMLKFLDLIPPFEENYKFYYSK